MSSDITVYFERRPDFSAVERFANENRGKVSSERRTTQKEDVIAIAHERLTIVIETFEPKRGVLRPNGFNWITSFSASPRRGIDYYLFFVCAFIHVRDNKPWIVHYEKLEDTVVSASLAVLAGDCLAYQRHASLLNLEFGGLSIAEHLDVPNSNPNSGKTLSSASAFAELLGTAGV